MFSAKINSTYDYPITKVIFSKIFDISKPCSYYYFIQLCYNSHKQNASLSIKSSEDNIKYSMIYS